MQSSVNTWKSEERKPSKKGTRASKNILKPRGHVESGLGQVDLDEMDLNIENTSYGSTPMSDERSSLQNMSIIQLTWALIVEVATKVRTLAINSAQEKIRILRYGRENFVHDTAGGEMPDPDRTLSQTEFH